MKKLSKQFFHLPLYLYVVMFLFIFCTAIPVFSYKHFFYNLEPYPDSFTYVVPPLNLARGGTYTLSYKHSEIVPNIISSYSLALYLGFAISSYPQTILVVNIILGVLSILTLYCILNELKIPDLIKCATLLAFLLHSVMLWLPTLPLTENIAIPLLLLAVLGTIRMRKNNSISYFTILCISLLLLFHSRSSMSLTAFSLWLFVTAVQVLQKKYWRVSWLVATAFITYAIYWTVNRWISLEPAAIINSLSAHSRLNQYYSTSFIFSNLLFYSKTLLGVKGTLLWLSESLTSAVISVFGISGLLLLFLNKRKFLFGVFTIALFTPLVAPLVFYHQDIRYAVTTVPVLLILSAYIFSQTSSKSLQVVLGLLLFASLILSQLSFYKFIVSQNVFLNSTPWQYEAIKNIENTVPAGKIIVTALPPYLSTLYYPDSMIELLPLSTHQEFISKGRNSWSREINTGNLLQYYSTLSESEEIYITNAYITHQQSVVTDYEAFKDYFNLELVSEGCLSACNIYKISRKDTQTD